MSPALAPRPTRRLSRLSLTALATGVVVALAVPPAVAAPGVKPGGPFVPSQQQTVSQEAFLSSAEVAAQLEALARRSKGALDLRVLGESGEGKPLYGAVIGTGETRVWLQGRIHGNEPYGPDALLALLKELVAGGAGAQALLSEITFMVIPDYNPDGADAFTRADTVERIDLNRDWGVSQDTLDQVNELRAEKGQRPISRESLTQFQAAESRAFYYAWADFKPHYAIDIHHQGSYYVSGSDEMTTFSLGVPVDASHVDPEIWELSRQMGVVAAAAADRRGTVTTTRYPYIDLPWAATSAMMVGGPGPEGEDAGWETATIFFENRGGIGQKSRGMLVQQNLVALRAVMEAIATGALDDVDADGWEAIPARGSFIPASGPTDF